MKRSIILLVLALATIALIMMGCAPATPEPQNPAEIAMTMAAQKMDAEATQMRIGIQYTATAQVIEVTQSVMNTQAAAAVTEQFRADVQATDQQNRRDLAATEQQQRQDAAATEQRIRDDAATQQARRDAEATAEQGRQNVIGTSTAEMAAVWNAATLQVMPTHDLWTQQAVIVEQALATNDVELSNLQVEQQSEKNTLEWVIPLLVVLAVVAVFAVVQIRRSRVVVVRNEETGEVETVIHDNVKMLKPQNMAGPVLLLDAEVRDVPADEQSNVTRMALGVQALKALPPNVPPQMAAGLYNGVFASTAPQRPEIDVVDAESVREWVNDVTRQADDQEVK